MTLNSSGPISLGGSTTGQSINLELGVSATALADINSTSFRTLAGVASGAISLSNFYGKSNASFFVAGLYNGSTYVGNCGFNGNGTSFTAIASDNLNTYNYIYRISASGTVNSSFSVTPNLTNVSNVGVNVFSVDSSNNIYILYQGSSYRASIINSSNAITTVYNIIATGYSGNGVNLSQGYAFDGTNIYYPSSVVSGGCCCSSSIGFVKTNTSGSGTLYYNDNFGGSPTPGTTITIDGSGNVYQVPFSSGNFYKFNSSGLGTANAVLTTGGIRAFSTYQSSYLAMAMVNTGVSFIGLYNISSFAGTTKPTLISSYSLSNGGDGTPVISSSSAVCFDSSGNSYFCFASTTSSSGFWVIKLNTSGTVQWSRNFSGYSSGSSPLNLTIAIVGTSVLISANIYKAGVGNAFFYNYPTDGSKTGSYTINGITTVISSSSINVTGNSVAFSSSALPGTPVRTASVSVSSTYTPTTGTSPITYAYSTL